MSAAIVIKRGDTRSAIKAMLKSPEGAPVNLTGASVRFIMVSLSGAPKIDRQIDALDASGGLVLVAMESADVDTAGVYRGEFEVTFPDGRKETYPNDDYLVISIVPDLG